MLGMKPAVTPTKLSTGHIFPLLSGHIPLLKNMDMKSTRYKARFTLTRVKLMKILIEIKCKQIA